VNEPRGRKWSTELDAKEFKMKFQRELILKLAVLVPVRSFRPRAGMVTGAWKVEEGL
jgi:hypothetical protein